MNNNDNVAGLPNRGYEHTGEAAFDVPTPNQIREAIKATLSGMGIEAEVFLPNVDHKIGNTPMQPGEFDEIGNLSRGKDEFDENNNPKEGWAEEPTPESSLSAEEWSVLATAQDRTIKRQDSVIKLLTRTGDDLAEAGTKAVDAVLNETITRGKVIDELRKVVEIRNKQNANQAKTISEGTQLVARLQERVNNLNDELAEITPQLAREYNKGWSGAISGLVEAAEVYDLDRTVTVEQVLNKVKEFRKS